MQPTCSFWNTTTQQWSTEGCVVLDSEVSLPDGRPGILCSCSHLTEFSVLVDRFDGVSCASKSGWIFVGLYGAITAIAVWQLLRYFIYFHTSKITPLVVQLALIFALGVIRVIGQSIRAMGPNDFPIALIAVTSALPYLLIFGSFTYLVFQWSWIASFVTKPRFKRYQKIACSLSVFAVTGAVVVLFIAVLSAPKSSRSTVARVASIVIGVLSLMMTALFVYFGRALSNLISHSDAPSSNHNEERKQSSNRIRIAAAMSSLAFTTEAVIWIISPFYADSIDVLTSIFLSCELVAAVTIIVLFAGTITAHRDKSSASASPQAGLSHRSTDPARRPVNSSSSQPVGSKVAPSLHTPEEFLSKNHPASDSVASPMSTPRNVVVSPRAVDVAS